MWVSSGSVSVFVGEEQRDSVKPSGEGLDIRTPKGECLHSGSQHQRGEEKRSLLLACNWLSSEEVVVSRSCRARTRTEDAQALKGLRHGLGTRRMAAVPLGKKTQRGGDARQARQWRCNRRGRMRRY